MGWLALIAVLAGWVWSSNELFSWQDERPFPTLMPTADLLSYLTQSASPIPEISPPHLQPLVAGNQRLHTPSPATEVAHPFTPSPIPLPATNTPFPTPIASPFHLRLTPGSPQGYLDKFRLVAYYGSPVGPGLGILGEYPREEMVALLRETAVAYEPFSFHRIILPAFHMIVQVANPSPPTYSHTVSLEVIEEWVAAAEKAEVAVILDLQPGQENVMTAFNRIRHLLYRPHVHLAIDPEFTMTIGEVPGINLGQLYAHQINPIQADLNQIGYEIGLNRVLILHQFTDSMLPDKAFIEAYPFVELVIDGDGVGAAEVKINNYNRYTAEPAFEYGGFKLFPTDGDYPLLSPAEVMTVLQPPPVIIIYQ